MPSTDRTPSPRLFAGALLAASGLQLVELLLPRIPLIPWLRPGFSWIVILPFLLDFGLGPALALFLGRNLLSMAFGGQPASTFLISSVSGAATLGLLGPLLRSAYGHLWIARAGAGIMLAAGFNTLQLMVVAGVLVGSAGYFDQLGPLLLWSAASGLLVAWLSLPLGDGRGWARLESLAPLQQRTALSEGSPMASLLAALGMIASLVAPSIWTTALLLAAALAWGRGPALRAALHTWPFLPYLAWFHLLDTPGDLIAGEWTTRQGVARFALHTLHLWAFTAFGRILTSRLPWSRLLHIDSPWTRGFALALPHVPHLFPSAMAAGRTWWRDGRPDGGRGLLDRLIEHLSTR